MKKTNDNFKICAKGHSYNKTSDCPTCPVCEELRKPREGFLSLLVAPARRALEANGINTLKKLAQLSEKEILNFHGIGPSTLPILKKELAKEGLRFTK